MRNKKKINKDNKHKITTYFSQIIIPIIISIVLSYLVSIKTAKDTIHTELVSSKTNDIYNSLNDFINIAERFSSLLNTIITNEFNLPDLEQNRENRNKLFKEKENIIYEKLLEFDILSDITNKIDNLEKTGFIKICMSRDSIAEDKITSLILKVKNKKDSDIEKIKFFHIICYNFNLLSDLKSYNYDRINEYVETYMK